jgi:hypothetical protein
MCAVCEQHAMATASVKVIEKDLSVYCIPLYIALAPMTKDSGMLDCLFSLCFPWMTKLCMIPGNKVML